VVITCARCGKQVSRRPRDVRERNYCSRTCHYASRAPRPARKKGTDKICEVCGATFYVPAARASARFCSMACKGVASRRTFTCETCGAESYGFDNRNKRWCSRACAASARRTGERRSCAQCGTDFYVTAGRAADGGGGRFCSLTCHNTHQGRGKTEHSCAVCGTTFRWSPSRSASGAYRITYCSLACRDADPARRAQLLEMNTAQQAGRTTRAEATGYALLDALGVDYLRQEPFAGKFTPDATIPAGRLVVQFDGDYWHDRDGTSAEPRIRRRVALDRSQDAYIRACGWQVLRLWESDLLTDPGACTERLRHHLQAADPG